MSVSSLRTRRIREWVKYPIILEGACRAGKCEEAVADTPEGLYCLAHYTELRSCARCGAATDQYVSDSPICAVCQDSDIELVLMSSSLSRHAETPGHDTISQGSGDINRGFSKKLRDAGYKDISHWAQARRNNRSA